MLGIQSISVIERLRNTHGDSVHCLLICQEPRSHAVDSPRLLSMLSRVPPTPRGQALAESLKSNGSVRFVNLRNNNIGDRGAEALLAECLPVLGCVGG